MYYAAFSPDGKKLVSRSGDRSIKVWDSTAEQEARVVRDETQPLRSVSFSPGGNRVAFALGRWDRTVAPPADVEYKICELPSGRELFRIKTPSDAQGVRVTFSPDGQRFLYASRLDARIFDGASGKELLTLPGRLWTPAFSPDGKRLACQIANASNTGRRRAESVKVLDLQTGQELWAYKAHSEWINHLVYSPDGKRLATHSADGTAKILDAETGKEILTIKVRLPRNLTGTVDFSPDGKRLAIASLASDYNASSGGIGEVKLLDSETGKELLSFKGHTALVQNVVFSPDGRRLASASARSEGRTGGEIKLWDAEKGYDLLTLKDVAFSGRIAFGQGGNWLATDASGVIKIYDATPLLEKP
jgi:WD40 repeat protein